MIIIFSLADVANLDPDSGGLVVYTLEAPIEWNFNEFNGYGSQGRIMEYLNVNNAERHVSAEILINFPSLSLQRLLACCFR